MALTCLVVRSWVRFTLLPVLRELARKSIRKLGRSGALGSEVAISEGNTVAEAGRKIAVTERTFYR